MTILITIICYIVCVVGSILPYYIIYRGECSKGYSYTIEDYIDWMEPQGCFPPIFMAFVPAMNVITLFVAIGQFIYWMIKDKVIVKK